MAENHRKLITSKCVDCNCDVFHRPNKPTLRCRKCAYVSKRNKVDVECSYCGKLCQRRPSSLNNSKHQHHFCNRECKEKAQSLSGNCPDIRPSHYGDSNGKHLVKILIKNAKKCSSCEESRKYLLVVHHIDSNRENNTNENLEVVCCNCHNKRHLKLDENNEWIYDNKFLTPRNMLNIL